MPLPRRLGSFNRRVTNPVLRPIVLRLPGFGEIVHVGRRSGVTYRTPVLAFGRGATVVFALTYGPQTEWVQNIRAAGRCRFETRTERLTLADPRLRHDPSRHLVPRPVRLALTALDAADFLELVVVARDRIRLDT